MRAKRGFTPPFLHRKKSVYHAAIERAGFTLIEVLIALSILMVIVSSTYMVFRGASRSWAKGEVRAERYQQARIILERMTMEISSSLITPWGSLFCYGEGDKIFFICPLVYTLSQEAGLPTSDLVEVGYYLEENEHVLVRHYQTDPDYDFATFDSEDELGLGITRLDFSYYDKGTWKNSWDSRRGQQDDGELPQAVKIVITVRDEKGRTEETFSTIVSLATSN